MSRFARLSVPLAVLVTASAALASPLSAGAAPELPATSQMTVPTDENGLGKVIVAFDGGVIPSGTLRALRDLGVDKAVELPTIGAVAVTATRSPPVASTQRTMAAVPPSGSGQKVVGGDPSRYVVSASSTYRSRAGRRAARFMA